MASKNWFRKVVPAGYEQATLMLTGTAPLLMKAGDFDPDSDEYRSFELLGVQPRKSLDERQRLRELEWTLSMYMDEQLGPVIPSNNVHELLREAATKWRKGAEISRSLVITEFRLPLIYDGPRDQQGLWDKGFRYTTMAANGGVNRGRVQRCRPMFPGWSLVAEIAYDPEALDFHLLERVVENSQKYGLGDYRPMFGSFEAVLARGELHKAGTNGSAIKPVDRDRLVAHLAFVERIVTTETNGTKRKAKAKV
jgi:hypothetical protein